MSRIIAIDFGIKRTGLAVTDPLKIIATPLETIPSNNLLKWIAAYIEKEEIERIVIGLPVNLDLSATHATEPVKNIIKKINLKFPTIPISTEDERFTSKIARQAMILGGMKKKDRREKSNVDKISASIILQSYMAKNL